MERSFPMGIRRKLSNRWSNLWNSSSELPSRNRHRCRKPYHATERPLQQRPKRTDRASRSVWTTGDRRHNHQPIDRPRHSRIRIDTNLATFFENWTAFFANRSAFLANRTTLASKRRQFATSQRRKTPNRRFRIRTTWPNSTAGPGASSVSYTWKKLFKQSYSQLRDRDHNQSFADFGTRRQRFSRRRRFELATTNQRHKWPNRAASWRTYR